MRLVKEHIAGWQAVFQRHPFFERFAGAASIKDAMAFAPNLMFWVRVFQDILRLNHTLIRDPAMKTIATHHREEDAGHESWFVADLAALGAEQCDVEFLFSPENAMTRDTAYGLVSEVYRATDDRVRIAFVLALESAGHVFFERTAAYIEKVGLNGELRYFSSSHLKVEKEHTLYDDRSTELVDDIILSPALREESFGMIERVYHAFIAMFDGLADVEHVEPPPSRLRAHSGGMPPESRGR
jgi:hypothetical protein